MKEKKLLNVNIIFLYLHKFRIVENICTFVSLLFSFYSYFSHFINWVKMIQKFINRLNNIN